MKLRHGLGILTVLVFALAGCTGDQGPAGPAGPQGEQGEKGDPGDPGSSFTSFAYQGSFGEACQHCHAGTVDAVLTTEHTNAYLDLGSEQGNLFCLQCHTTGFNCAVDNGDTEIDPASCWEPDDGYSGYIGDDTELGMERRLALEGVQCEGCHGAMGPNFNAHRPKVSFSTHDDPATGESTSLCYGCHSFQVDEWKNSAHANAAGGDLEALNDEWGRSSCDYCHSSEGFIETYDPMYSRGSITDEITWIGCPTCHDPHAGSMGGGNAGQLRTIAPVVLSYYDPADEDNAPTAEGYGPGQTCMQCHKARRDYDNVSGQIASGSSHFGPHASPQTDMFIGAGSYEIPDYTYEGPDQGHNALITTGCPRCHMAFDQEPAPGGAAPEGHTVHNFEPEITVCTVGCHVGATDFNINGVQDSV